MQDTRFGFSVCRARGVGLILGGALAFIFSLGASAGQDSQPQQPAPAGGNQPAAAPAPPPAAAADHGQPGQAPLSTESPSAPAADQSTAAPAAASPPGPPAEITEDEVKKLLVGKQLFLRGGYLDNSLSFNEHGGLVGHSPQGSYTLNGMEIDKVRLTRHKVELEGERYGLHFLGELPYEDPTKAVDRVNITPKKKLVRITIDRELVVKPKKPKGKHKSVKDSDKPMPKAVASAPTIASGSPAANPAFQTASVAEQAATPSSPPGANQSIPPADSSDAAEAKAEIAAAPPAERPADPNSITTTTSPAHAKKVLLDAFDNIFAQPFDARMMDAMPGFWKLYYEAAAAKTDYRPKDPAVLRQSMVDQKAKLVSRFEPPSNEYAQTSGVAGMSLYHVVIGADGKPGEIAVARPIGFGLDENAVEAIRKAAFEPAMKDGKPVTVLLDLVVQFRIYSKRTAVMAPQNGQPDQPSLPGPYSVHH